MKLSFGGKSKDEVICPECGEETKVPPSVEFMYGGTFDCESCDAFVTVVPDEKTRIKLERNGGPWKGGWIVRKV